jgi:hypothetical protein
VSIVLSTINIYSIGLEDIELNRATRVRLFSHEIATLDQSIFIGKSKLDPEIKWGASAGRRQIFEFSAGLRCGFLKTRGSSELIEIVWPVNFRYTISSFRRNFS